MPFVELNHKGEEAVHLEFSGTWYRFPYYVLTSIADQHYTTASEWDANWKWKKDVILYQADGFHKEPPATFYEWLDGLCDSYWKEWNITEIKEFLQPHIGALDAYIDYRKVIK